MIKTARKKRKLTQEPLGSLVGVKKAQISRLDNLIAFIQVGKSITLSLKRASQHPTLSP